MKKYTLPFFYFLFSCGFLFPQHLNRSNRHGERRGKWIVYMDDEKKIKSFEGRFRNGKPVGRAYYYTMAGILERVEISRFKTLKTTFYYPSKVKRLKGKAKIENLDNKVTYYFYGTWKQYDEKGKLVKYCYYDKGKLIKTKYCAKGTKTNDSLIYALNNIEKDFFEANKLIIDSIHASASSPVKSEAYKKKLYQADTLNFRKIEKILSCYGYPPKEVAQESNDIPFYILNFATTDVREKYLPLFEKAADKGELSRTTLAIYIDKIKVAKGEAQIYGTQYFYDAHKKRVYYPSVDPDNLEQRRKMMDFKD